MDCRQAKKLIPLVAGDDATAEENAAVRDHAAGCNRCAQELATFEHQVELFARATQGDVPQGLLDGLADRALAEATSPAPKDRPVLARLELLVPLAAAAALLLLVAGYGSGLLQSPAPTPGKSGGAFIAGPGASPTVGKEHRKTEPVPVPSTSLSVGLVQDTSSPAPYALPVLTASTGAVNVMEEAQPSAPSSEEPATEPTSYVLEDYDLADDAQVSLDF